MRQNCIEENKGTKGEQLSPAGIRKDGACRNSHETAMEAPQVPPHQAFSGFLFRVPISNFIQ